MKSKSKNFATLLALMLAAVTMNTEAAPLEGQFVLVGSSAQGTFNEGIFEETNPFEIYEFRVTNNTGVNIFTFQNLVFGGALLQVGGQTAKIGTQLSADPFDAFIPGVQLIPDSFFTDNNVQPTTLGGTVDSNSELSAVSVGTLGQAWIADGATEAIALFSVSQGQTPTFVGGGGTTGGTLTAITRVPEPTSLAMLGLGGLLVLRRRR